MKTILLSLILLSLPVVAQEPPKRELCVNPDSMQVMFVRQGEQIYLLTRALSCTGQVLTWVTDANHIEIVTVPEEEIKI